MVNFTDIFIRRPVLASVVSLLIFLFGLRAAHDLSLRQFPKVENTVITVTTAYPGASANLIQGFITTQLEKSMAGAEGIDYMTAQSSQGVSVIRAFIKLDYPSDAAFTSIMSKVAEVRGQLPRDSEQPVIKKESGSQISLMYISFNSTEMSPEQITDYITRVVQPKLQTVFGVAKAEILGGSTFAMRIWLNPERMAALNISPTDIAAALRNNNFQSTAGKTKGEYVAFTITATTGLHNAEEFKNLTIKSVQGTLIRLRDIAHVELGSEDYDSLVTFNGKKAIFVGVDAIPSANPLTVIGDIRKLLPELEKNFPSSLKATVVYDATRYISASISEVIHTIIEATIIVILVIFLFLGSFRSVIIPVVTIPLSLVGVCSFMLALGYSINLLTLLAMVLAIGMVVDDAIVVVENVHRHIEEGLSPFEAALQGAREIALPVISMTLTLAAVYAPIGFMSGVTGALFKEFAFTLAGAVIVSGIVALTLSPMMCSRVLKAEQNENKFVLALDRMFEKCKVYYQQKLHNSLNYRSVTVVFAATVLASCYFLYANTQQELAPDEDQSVLFVSSTAPQYANIDYVTKFTEQFNQIFKGFPETENYFVVNGMGEVNNVIAGVMLKPWDERQRTQAKVQPLMQEKLASVAGLNTVIFPLPSLPVGGGGLPLQFVITSTSSYELIYEYSNKLAEAAKKSGLFIFIDNSLKFNKLDLEINIDHNKAASLGISMQEIGDALATTLGGNYVNLFSMEGRSYRVIPQVIRKFRFNPEQLKSIYVRAESGELVPLATVATVTESVQPNNQSQFQQLNSATLQGMMMPGKTIGDGLAFLREQADKMLPKGFSYDYAEQSRQFIQEGSALMYTFFFAVIIIYLVLAAQFESFRDPWIILISVPMSICGALIPLNLGFATINIYTQVGLITLIGLISKHGILMVDFANQLQREEGLTRRAAMEKAAAIRLRPILMTTAAMILGVLPLVFAAGAGAASRYSIGLVVATGMFVGTLFTLFVVPTMYTLLAKERNVSLVHESESLVA